MRVVAYVYDSGTTPDHVSAVLDRLDARGEEVSLVDAAGEEGRREAMLTVREAVRIGTTPDELFDDDGSPDFSPGALITEAETGRRTLHVGAEALSTLR